MTASGRTILVVAEQPEVLRSLRQVLEREGHQVLAAASGSKALALLAGRPVDMCLVDYLMPVVQSELLLRAIRERDPAVPIVLLTERAGNAPSRQFLQRLGIHGCHDKLDGFERLLRWVELALEAGDQRARLRAADAALTAALDGLRIAQELVAECGALAATSTSSTDQRQRVAAELTMVLAKIDQWMRVAAAAGATAPEDRATATEPPGGQAAPSVRRRCSAA